MQENAHLFILDPLEKLNLALDTSLSFARELQLSHGQRIFCTELHQLHWHSKDPCASAEVRELDFKRSGGLPERKGETDTRMRLDTFSSIQMRKDPPFDMAYLTATWLLDSVGDRALVVNRPTALRSFNEKLSIFQFPELSTESFLSADPDRILEFAETVGGEIVLKPLDLFGGRGVERLNVRAAPVGKAREHLLRMTEAGTSPRLAQPFNPRIHDGEVRVFTAFGEPVSWCLKKPKAGEFLANTAAGASLSSYQPSELLETRIRKVAGRLLEEGIALIGFDVIGEDISEINITSPRLLFANEAERAQGFKLLAQRLMQALARRS